MSARWEEALDLQMETWRWMDSAKGAAFMMGWAPRKDLRDDIDKARAFGRTMGAMVSTAVFNADPLWVEPDMMTVVEAAVRQFQPEPLSPTDLITESGFLVLPRPLTTLDARGKSITYRAIGWSPMAATRDAKGELMVAIGGWRSHEEMDVDGSGILLTLWNHKADHDDYTDSDIRLGRPRLLCTHLVPWTFGAAHPGSAGADSVIRAGSMLTLVDGTEVPVEVNAASSAAIHQQVQGIWRLMQQTLADVGTRDLSRDARRWATRAKFPEKRIVVVNLRRPHKDPDEDHVPTAVHWTHQWVVGGHWRNQWYPSEGIHRQIWISPFVKGPADKPLVLPKARVFAVVR